MTSTLTLNCIFLRNLSLQPQDEIVPVSIDSSATFNDLRKMIFPFADIIKLSETRFFELQPHISIMDDKFMESFPQAIKSARSLSSIRTISSIFPKQPDSISLHIAIQTSCVLHLSFVLITGNKISTERYSVKVDNAETVAELKRTIRKLKNLSGQVDIWKVSLPINKGLTENVKQAISDKKSVLSDYVELIDVFPFTFENHLHMVVEAVGKCRSMCFICYANHQFQNIT